MKSAKDMSVGERLTVKEVYLTGDALRRISDMGLTVGADVELAGVAPLGDPLLLKVRGFYMSVRKCDAAKIFVSQKVSARKV